MIETIMIFSAEVFCIVVILVFWGAIFTGIFLGLKELYEYYTNRKRPD